MNLLKDLNQLKDLNIFDELGNPIADPDLGNGKLVEEVRRVVHKYIVTQEEEGHYETIAEYPNGGKDVDWVVDVPEEGHWVAYDEDGNEVETNIVIPDDAPHEIDIPDTQEFYRYIIMTAEELAEKAKDSIRFQINELKDKLSETDYITNKAMDSLMGCTGLSDLLGVLASFNKEYKSTIEQRQQWRDEINKLEEELQ